MGKLFKLALALFLIGIGVFAIFTAISDEPIWGSVDEEDYTYNELLYDADDFTGLNFDFINRDFIVRESEDDQIKVVYYTTERDEITITDSGNVLGIVNKVEWYLQLFSGWNTWTTDEVYFDVQVFLPSSEIYDIDLDTSNGTFDMVDIDYIDVLKFDTSNGRIVLTNVEATSMDLDTSNGTITLTDCISDSFDLYTSNGTISLTDVSATGLVKLKTSNGKLLLTDVEAGTINGKTSNSRIEALNIDCDDVTLDSSNGSVTLSIYGDKDDFEVRMDTSNGDMTYDGIEVSQEEFNLGKTKKIYLDTSNGDVDLIFLEE